MIKVYRSDIFMIESLIPLWLEMVREIKPDAKPNIDWWIEYMENCFNQKDYRCYHAIDVNGLDISEINTVEKFDYIGFIDAFAMRDPIEGILSSFSTNFYVKPDYRPNASIKLYKRILDEGKNLGVESVEMICYKNTSEWWLKHGAIEVKHIMRRKI